VLAGLTSAESGFHFSMEMSTIEQD